MWNNLERLIQRESRKPLQSKEMNRKKFEVKVYKQTKLQKKKKRRRGDAVEI
jgi:hypothetical protein